MARDGTLDMSYGVATIRRDPTNQSHSNIDIHDQFDHAEFQKFNRACKALLTLGEQEEYTLIERNYQHLKATTQYYATVVSVDELKRGLNRRKMVSHFASDILNWLTGTRFYVDHVMKRFSDLFQKNSAEYVRLRAAVANEYDTSIEYRVMYYFRNYVQHSGFPVDHINTSLDSGEGHVFHAYVDQSRLLNAYDWKVQIRRDIESLPSSIDVLALIEAAQPCFRRIQAVVLECLVVRALAELDTVREVAAMVPEDNGEPHLISYAGLESSATGSALSINVLPVPVQVSDLLRSEQFNSVVARLAAGEGITPAAPEPTLLDGLDDDTLNDARVGSRLILAYHQEGDFGPLFTETVQSLLRASSNDIAPVIKGLTLTAAVAITMVAGATQTSTQAILESIARSLGDQGCAE